MAHLTTKIIKLLQASAAINQSWFIQTDDVGVECSIYDLIADDYVTDQTNSLNAVLQVIIFKY